EGARQVIVVDVGFEHLDDPPALRLRGPDEPPGITLWIDEDGLAPAREQVRGVAQPLGHEELEVHRRHRDTAATGGGPASLVPFDPWRRSAMRPRSSSSIRTTCSTGAPRPSRPAFRPAS